MQGVLKHKNKNAVCHTKVEVSNMIVVQDIQQNTKKERNPVHVRFP